MLSEMFIDGEIPLVVRLREYIPVIHNALVLFYPDRLAPDKGEFIAKTNTFTSYDNSRTQSKTVAVG